MRQFHIVASVGQLLVNLPIFSGLDSLGRYYEALHLNRRDVGETASAEQLFAQVADRAPTSYRARAMLALGTNQIAAGDHNYAASFYRDVIRILTRDRAFDPVTLYFAGQMTAVVRAMEGDHLGALADLQNLLPLVRSASTLQPYAYYDYLNSLAVELGEAGRLQEAQRASETALRSHYSRVYPNWRDTFDDIVAKQRRASRSLVTVSRPLDATHNLVRMPASEQTVSEPAQPDPEGTQAQVLSFQQWKTMLKGARRPVPNKLAPERSRMTTAEKLMRLMDLISQDETDDETIDRVLEAVEEIVISRRNQILD